MLDQATGDGRLPLMVGTERRRQIDMRAQLNKVDFAHDRKSADALRRAASFGPATRSFGGMGIGHRKGHALDAHAAMPLVKPPRSVASPQALNYRLVNCTNRSDPQALTTTT